MTSNQIAAQQAKAAQQQADVAERRAREEARANKAEERIKNQEQYLKYGAYKHQAAQRNTGKDAEFWNEKDPWNILGGAGEIFGQVLPHIAGNIGKILGGK